MSCELHILVDLFPYSLTVPYPSTLHTHATLRLPGSQAEKKENSLRNLFPKLGNIFNFPKDVFFHHILMKIPYVRMAHIIENVIIYIWAR